jgi:hypothetical protein
MLLHSYPFKPYLYVLQTQAHHQQEKGNHGANTKIPTTLLPKNPICSNDSEATMEFKSEVILFCKSTED